MTTIVATRNAMAADSLFNDGGIRAYGTKLFRVGDKIVGTAGNRNQGLKFARWFETQADEDRPDTEHDRGFEALVLYPDGRLELWNADLIADEIEEDFWAIGSGSAAALAAMHMGADIKRAVEIAALVDIYTGGDVKQMHFAAQGPILT